MKKFYMILLAAMMFTASQAQDMRPARQKVGQRSTIVNAGEKVCDTPLKSLQQLKHSSMAKAPQKADSLDLSGLELITEQPEGNATEMVKTSSYFYVFWGSVYYTDNSGNRTILVEGTDGYYYMYEPLSAPATGTWLRLEKDGDELVAKLPQAIYHEDASTYYDEETYYAFAMTVSFSEGDEGTEISTDFCDTQEFRFVYKGDSIVAKDPTMMLGLCDDEGSWVYYGDYNISMTEFGDKPVEVDADVAASAMTFSLKYTDLDYGTSGYIVSGAFDGNGHVYVKGVFPSAPDAWVEGTFDGQKAVFPSSQYMGYSESYSTYTYFEAATAEEIYDEEYDYSYLNYTLADNITFDVDMNTLTMTTDGGVLLNCNKHEYVYYIDGVNKPEIALWTETAGTPENPQFWSFSDYFDTDGWSSIATYLPVFDTTGKLMDTNKMTYSYYIDDDELVELSPDDGYTDINGNPIEAISALPYDYACYGAWGYDCYNYLGVHYLYIYFTGFDRIGVQTTYNGGGESHSSDIIYYVVNNTDDGVDKPMADVTSVRYTDLSGRTVQKPGHGLYIKTTTLTDGTVKSTKVMMR